MTDTDSSLTPNLVDLTGRNVSRRSTVFDLVALRNGTLSMDEMQQIAHILQLKLSSVRIYQDHWRKGQGMPKRTY